MITATLDDEQLAVNALVRKLKKIDPNGIHEGFVRLADLMDFADHNYIDIVFLDIDLSSSINGLDLIRHLYDKYGDMNIIIYTGHPDPEYKAAALDNSVCGYILKPVSEEELKAAIAHIRRPIRELNIQCFGHFEVFFGTDPVRFERRDSKEVLAFLIDKRGAAVSEEELRYLLFGEEDDGEEKRSYIRNVIYDIRKTLGRYGVPKEMITNLKGAYSIDRSMLRCDYYDYLEGRNVPTARLGQYMEQYPWAAGVRSRLFG
ncbi:MAG: response regulator [Ruminococcus sp.]|nr:response regulator [Ruminococcus sp.]